MNILFSSLHQIDHVKDAINEIDITGNGNTSDLGEYVQILFNEITSKANTRNFIFGSDTTEVRNTVDKYLKADFQRASEINAARLLKIEKQAQENISKLSIEIQRGSLFQAFIQNGRRKQVIICKADHSAYLDESDFKFHQGLPWKKKIYKAAIVDVDERNIIGKVYVYDTNLPMAKYWWRDFLELSEVYTDSYNTKTALDVLDRKVFNRIKNDFPADHTLLRNSTIKYFRSQGVFDITDYVDGVFRNYLPVDPDFPRDDLADRVFDLPQKWDFDPSFEIIKDEIKKRTVESKIELTEKIDLVFNDYIDNLESLIVSGLDLDGKKFIKIYTDNGYERFKSRKTQ